LNTTATPNSDTAAAVPHDDASPDNRLQPALSLLDAIIADRDVMEAWPAADRERLLQAVALVHHPEPRARRRKSKDLARERAQEKARATEALLDQTGIRTLRRKPVFTTPNLPPAPEIEPQEVENNPEFREVVEPQNCYICKKDYSTIHHFYDQLCPKCADLNFRKRTELADLRGRVALLTGGRVKIGYQAGIKLLRAGAQLIVTTRFPRDSAMRYAQEPDFAEWGFAAGDLRPRSAAHAERRGVLPAHDAEVFAAGFHHQQRVPDRAPSAAFLRAHDGRPRLRRCTTCPIT
jgi:hypothetical protein